MRIAGATRRSGGVMIPDSEYNIGALIIFLWGFAMIGSMMLWDKFCERQRNRRRGSYQRHPSQRKDLYYERNRGTVQK